MSEKQIITTKTVDGEVRSFDRSKLNEVEEVLVLRQHNARPEFEKFVRRFFPGEKYKISGLAKAEGIMYGYTTTDLNAKIPESRKRTMKDAEADRLKLELAKDGTLEMQKQIKEMQNQIKDLTEKSTSGKK